MLRKNILKFASFHILVLLVLSCSTEEPTPGVQPTGKSQVYQLEGAENSTIAGSVKFIENSDNSTTIELSLQNAPASADHPAHIHFNSAVETGSIAATLSSVDATSGKSSTTLTQLDNGTLITYDEWLEFDGHVNIHSSASDLTTLLAQADIGQNEMTGESKSYTLNSAAVPDIDGSVFFEERRSGEILCTITLNNTPAGGSHPAHIHMNSVADGGDVLFTFNSVNGDTGISKTHLASLDDNSPVNYQQLLQLNGHVKVHLSAQDQQTIVAQGNIGSNEDTGSTIQYTVSNTGSSAYVFTGNGLSNASNPALTLQKGKTYIFNISTPGHPFFINGTQGTGTSNAFTDGVSNNGIESGTITFIVPNNAPSGLFYNCQFHAAMTNTITIID